MRDEFLTRFINEDDDLEDANWNNPVDDDEEEEEDDNEDAEGEEDEAPDENDYDELPGGEE